MFYKPFTLKNGIRSVYVSKRDLHISCINIVFKTGSKNESSKQLGISHFLEHMFFKGTKKHPNNQDITFKIESLGGYINAYTTKDTTCYIVKINTKHLQVAIDVLSEILLHSLLRKKDIEYEKNVVVEELISYLDDPNNLISKQFNTHIFKDTPLTLEPIGTIENINNFTRSEVVNYMNKYYTSDNMHIIISSNLSFKRVQHMLNQSAFTKFTPTSVRKNLPFQYIPNETTSVEVKYKNIKQEKIIIGFPICDYNNDDKYVLNLVSELLTANMSSRLFVDLREKNPLVYNVSSDVEYYQDMGIFYIQTETELRNVVDIDNTVIDTANEFLQSLFGKKPLYNRKTEKGVLSIIFDNIRDLQKNEISKKELEATKQSIVGSYLLNSESSEAVIGHYEQESIYNYSNITSIRNIPKKYDKIKSKDILKICNKYLTKQTMFVNILGKSNENSIKQFISNYKRF